MAKRSSFGSIMRKRFSDINNTSNPHRQSNSPIDLGTLSPSSAASSTKHYTDSLPKENMALVKFIGDKNKIIELSGIRLQKLCACLQKMQLQNWSLAQSHNHMQEEFNIVKIR